MIAAAGVRCGRLQSKPGDAALVLEHEVPAGCVLDGVMMEVVGSGLTGGLAFDQAAQAIASGRAGVALALGAPAAIVALDHDDGSLLAARRIT